MLIFLANNLAELTFMFIFVADLKRYGKKSADRVA